MSSPAAAAAAAASPPASEPPGTAAPPADTAAADAPARPARDAAARPPEDSPAEADEAPPGEDAAAGGGKCEGGGKEEGPPRRPSRLDAEADKRDRALAEFLGVIDEYTPVVRVLAAVRFLRARIHRRRGAARPRARRSTARSSIPPPPVFRTAGKGQNALPRLIPDLVMDYYLNKAGFDCDDVRTYGAFYCAFAFGLSFCLPEERAAIIARAGGFFRQRGRTRALRPDFWEEPVRSSPPPGNASSRWPRKSSCLTSRRTRTTTAKLGSRGLRRDRQRCVPFQIWEGVRREGVFSCVWGDRFFSEVFQKKRRNPPVRPRFPSFFLFVGN
ncbi:MAG: hypothetical protein BJ554DRAFT_573 [Olpidium bornovanus]|uniref:Uncharacterized protein n=1 Tax=Olpidium bornovanus TaxID=278681 RepID=A0A8H8DI15_9FUNG|nr:MAG: hypothetical protein BJ554DRAFT_573 [Olpidium bornovanus]